MISAGREGGGQPTYPGPADPDTGRAGEPLSPVDPAPDRATTKTAQTSTGGTSTAEANTPETTTSDAKVASADTEDAATGPADEAARGGWNGAVRRAFG